MRFPAPGGQERDDRRDDRRDRRRDRHHHDKDHHQKRPPETVTERLKAKSTQSGQDALNAAPSSMPDPANADAVYTTGAGSAVEYNYARTGTYADLYAAQEENQRMTTEHLPAAMGPGQVITSGAANNPT